MFEKLNQEQLQEYLTDTHNNMMEAVNRFDNGERDGIENEILDLDKRHHEIRKEIMNRRNKQMFRQVVNIKNYKVSGDDKL